MRKLLKKPGIIERLRFTFTANGKRQTSDLSWEFLKIENKQIKTVQNNSYGWNWRETTYFWVEVINSTRQSGQLREKLGHEVQIHVSRLA